MGKKTFGNSGRAEGLFFFTKLEIPESSRTTHCLSHGLNANFSYP